MYEYETKPLDHIIKRNKQAKKNYLKWYDDYKAIKPKNITAVVNIMQEAFYYKDKLFV